MTHEREREPEPEPPAERPPLGSWSRLYAIVIAVLVLDIVLLLALTERFR